MPRNYEWEAVTAVCHRLPWCLIEFSPSKKCGGSDEDTEKPAFTSLIKEEGKWSLSKLQPPIEPAKDSEAQIINCDSSPH